MKSCGQSSLRSPNSGKLHPLISSHGNQPVRFKSNFIYTIRFVVIIKLPIDIIVLRRECGLEFFVSSRLNDRSSPRQCKMQSPIQNVFKSSMLCDSIIQTVFVKPEIFVEFIVFYIFLWK